MCQLHKEYRNLEAMDNSTILIEILSIRLAKHRFYVFHQLYFKEIFTVFLNCFFYYLYRQHHNSVPQKIYLPHQITALCTFLVFQGLFH